MKKTSELAEVVHIRLTKKQKRFLDRSRLGGSQYLRMLLAEEMGEPRKMDRGQAAGHLLRAVGRWVEACGGKALVAGGIEVIKYPDDLEYNFRVAIRVTGRQPKKEVPHGL